MAAIVEFSILQTSQAQSINHVIFFMTSDFVKLSDNYLTQQHALNLAFEHNLEHSVKNF